MAVNSIGGVTFQVWQGDLQVPVERVQPIVRLGREFTRTRTDGRKSRAARIITSQRFANVGDAVNAMESTWPALVGTTVTCINSLNQSFENCTVMSYQVIRYHAIAGDAVYSHRVEAQWIIMPGEQS